MSEIYIPINKDIHNDMYVKQDFDGYFIGLLGYSSNFNYLVELEKLENIVNSINNKKIFISLNRLYYNDEIDKIRELLIKLNNMNITGITFSDVGVLEIARSINFTKELLWQSNHLGTNSNTIKFLNKRDVNYFLLSTEITKDEIIEIKNNCNSEKIGVNLYGHLNMATSSRKLLTNYFEYINKEKNNNKYIMRDKIKNQDYIVTEDKNTDFFTKDILNGIKFYPELLENNIDFIFLDDYMIPYEKFYNIIETFSSLRRAKDDTKFVETLEKVTESNTENNTFYGFLDKKTVFKVADYE